jgi:hypothetical protein
MGEGEEREEARGGEKESKINSPQTQILSTPLIHRRSELSSMFIYWWYKRN